MRYYLVAGEASGMGIWEVIVQARKLLGRVRSCEEDIAAWKPDVVILIDYPGFNFRIAEFAHKAGFKVFWYIAPKVWASRESRIKKLKAYVDKLFIVFPFEIDYFRRKGVDFIYKGNPLIDAVDRSPALQETREAFLKRHGLPDRPMVALLAGSRSGEIKSMMPVLTEFAARLHGLSEYADYQFVIAAAPGRTAEDYGHLDEYVHVVSGDTYGALRHARAAVINSGTASLEAALLGTPQVVGYRTAPLTYLIGRIILKIKYISLVSRSNTSAWRTSSSTVPPSRNSCRTISRRRIWYRRCAVSWRTRTTVPGCRPIMRKSVRNWVVQAPQRPSPRR